MPKKTNSKFAGVESGALLALLATALAVALILLDLGDIGLWVDEGETSVLARSILAHGVPRVDDQFAICPFRGLTEDRLWTAQPWFSFYVAASGLYFFGESIVGLRLPFALLGILCIPLLYRWARKSGDDSLTAGLAALILATSVPFLLLARNARYYALLPFFSLLLLILFESLRKRGSLRDVAWFGLASTFFVHTHQPAALVIVSSLVVASTVRREWRVVRNLLLSQALTLTAFLPWLAYSWSALREFYQARAHSTLGANVGFWDWFQGCVLYLIDLAHHHAPALLLLAVPFVKETKPNARSISNTFLVGTTLWMMALMSFLFNSNLWPGYVAAIFPLVALANARLLIHVGGKRFVMAGLFLVFTFTSVLNLPYVPWKLKADIKPATETVRERRWRSIRRRWRQKDIELNLTRFVGALFTPYVGPLEASADYIREHAAPGDRVFIPHDGPGFSFLSGLPLVQSLPFQNPPEWIVRRSFSDWGAAVCVEPGLGNVEEYIRKVVTENTYEIVSLDIHDAYHENEPIFPFHRFETQRGEPHVTLFHLKKAPNPKTP